MIIQFLLDYWTSILVGIVNLFTVPPAFGSSLADFSTSLVYIASQLAKLGVVFPVSFIGVALATWVVVFQYWLALRIVRFTIGIFTKG